MKVTGIGQCSLDYLALVDFYPDADTKKEILEWHEQGGGPVATALAALSRLGIRCSFYGVAGDDDAGDTIRRSLVEEGVDVSGLVTRRASSSQVAFIAVEKETGRRTIFWKRPTGGPLRSEELGAGFLDGSGMLLVDGLMAEVSLYAAEQAQKRSVPVMLDAGRMRPGMIELARLSDYVVGSEEFARYLGWKPTRETLFREREKLGIKILTITLGRRGSVTASSQGEYFDIPAFKIEAVDTTGAGDVFHGGYIYGLLRGWDLRETLTFASALAALKCMKVGGRAGIPKLEEVMKFLKKEG
ncbi:MAG: PfkB family carbohydrate kinase [Nitrospiraceae bacterium]|nr:PfkB family carbohydrate kinase [Nitrospiraceae bacterium]